MRLKSIKLAGFKSFVDPTTVNFPSNMAAVVGPNGCGKSNIIDAVRWVMGESSAKNLRGESMTDVIFNGSNTRKPVSQASIELIFDNAETTLVGEYAQYAEISIRRRVSRDGQNTYFLNGTKCRRRDITDIFLGTGLGPRSYSIIEQGMISKLIEARPEDLRNFIEEAAGISKYKERRRETESRIRRTQENLARLTDLREELGRQLERLHRQAQSAEKYQEHKAEERQLKAQLGAVRWRDLNEQVGQRERVIGDQEIAFEALVAEQRGADAGIERLRDGHHELSERFNQVQARFYSVGGDIARVEQSIQHGQQRQRQLQDDLREAERTRQETESHLGHDRTLLATLAEEMAMLAPEQELSAAAAEEAGIALEQAEQGMQAWQQQWDAFNQQSAEPRRQAEVQQSRIQHLEQSLERLQDRERRLQEERGQLAADPEDAAILELNEQVAIAELALEELQLQEQGQAERLEQLRQELQQLAAEQHQAQGELQRLNGRIASLEALQQAALDPGQGALEWLREQGLEQRPRLAEGLRVEPGWELAVETVLGADLQAVLLDGFDGLALAGFGKGELRLLSPARGAATAAGSLLDKVRADADLSPWLARVKPVETLEQALAQRGALDDGESLISRDGYWVGRHFLRVRRSDEAQGGMLARAQELEALQERREALETRVAEGEERLAAARDEQRELEGAREQVRRQVQEEGRRHGELKAQLSAQQAKVEQLVLRRRRLDEEVAELAEQRALEQEQLSEARLTLQEALDSMALDTERRETLLAERDALRERLDRIRQDARTHKDHAHQLAVRVGSLKAQHNSTQQALERLDQQSARLNERCEQLNLNLEEGAAPLEELRMKLEELLERRMAVEDELKQARLALEDADRELREVEKRRGQAEQQSQLLRGQLEQQRLAWQGWWCGAKPCRSSSPKTATTCIRYWPTCPGCQRTRLGGASRESRGAHPASGADQPGGDRGVPAAVRAQALPGLAERRPGRSAGDAGKRHPQDRPGNPQSFQGNLRPDQCWPSGIVPEGIRRRYGISGTYRRRSTRYRCGDHGAPAGQEEQHHPLVVRRGKGADRAGAGIRHLPVEPGAVLHARRSRCAIGRCQRRTLCAIGEGDVGKGAVHLYHPQQDRHGNGRSVDGRDHA